MSRNVPYQWICLRSIKTRLQIRSLSTTPPTQEEVEAATPQTTSSLKSYLETQDTTYLHQTQSHLSALKRTATTAHTIATALPTTSPISLLPGTPPYTSLTFRTRDTTLSTSTSNLLHQIRTLEDNLTDLEYTPYPTETAGAKRAEQFKKKVENWTQQEKEDELEDLRNKEQSHAGRLMKSMEKLRDNVEALEAAMRRKKDGESNGSSENGDVFRKFQGFGAGGTDIKAPGGVDGKTPNPWEETGKKEKGRVVEVKAKAKGSAGDAGKKNESKTKVADAVSVPKPAGTPKPTLADLQAKLSGNVGSK